MATIFNLETLDKMYLQVNNIQFDCRIHSQVVDTHRVTVTGYTIQTKLDARLLLTKCTLD